MNDNKDGYKEILNFIAEHGVENKDLQSKKKPNRVKSKKSKKVPEKVIDLHGKKEAEAESILRISFKNIHKMGIKKILVIHGKGIHSDPFDGPVLKKLVEAMLSNELKSYIREYYTAPQNRGGSGATIVILR